MEHKQDPRLADIFIKGPGFMQGCCWQAVEKHPSAALRSSLVIAAYRKVRLIPQDFARLAYGCF